MISLTTGIRKPAARYLIAAAAALFVLASCAPASTPQPTAVEELAAPQEQAAEQSAPSAEMALPADTQLKSQAAASPQVFSIEAANPFAPQDIIPAVGYFGGAEPGFCDQMSVDLQPRQVVACPSDSVEQMAFLALLTTGLANRERVNLTTVRPDGDQITETLVAGPGGTLRHTFIPDLADPTGEYQFSLDTSLGRLEKAVTVTIPRGAQMYLLPEASRLLLVNFDPGEKVRLFLYVLKPDIGLVLRAWEQLQVDDQGSLSMDFTDVGQPYFYAVGETSGLVPYKEKGASSLRQMWPGGDIACPGAPKPLPLDFDTTVSVVAQRVVAEIESYPEVFSFPVPRGTQLKLEEFWGAPRCRQGMIWWTAKCPRLPGLECQTNSRVWIPEGRGAEYFIQPSQP